MVDLRKYLCMVSIFHKLLLFMIFFSLMQVSFNALLKTSKAIICLRSLNSQTVEQNEKKANYDESSNTDGQQPIPHTQSMLQSTSSTVHVLRNWGIVFLFAVVVIYYRIAMMRNMPQFDP